MSRRTGSRQIRRRRAAAFGFGLWLSSSVVSGAEPVLQAWVFTAQVSDAGVEPLARAGRLRQVILLVRRPGDAAVVAHLRAQLLRTSWSVVEIRLDERYPATGLAQVAERQAADAAIMVNTEQGRVELWIKRAAGAIEETILAEGEQLSAWVLALRTTEALRAHGLPLEVTEAATPPAKPATPPAKPAKARARVARSDRVVEATAAAPSRVASLALGGSGLLSRGGVPPGFHALAGLELQLRRYRLSVLGMPPLYAGTLEGPEGTASVSSWLAGLGADRGFDFAKAVRLLVGAGILWSVHTFTGLGTSGYRGVHKTVVTAVPVLRGGMSWDWGADWQLGALAFVGASIPEVEVRFASRQVATWGRPLFGACLSVSFAFLAF